MAVHEGWDRVLAGRLLPVLVIRDVAGVEPLAVALIAAQVPVVEVTLRTPVAVQAIARFARYEQLTVGAGSVLSADQVDQVAGVGARFVVSPGFSGPVVARCRDRGVPAVPGVATGSEIMAALHAGVDLVKFFPAQAAGGPATLRALAAPFGGVRFIPTGGITADNAPDYLALDPVVAVGGSWMFPADAVADGDTAVLTAALRAAARATAPPAVTRARVGGAA